MTAEELQERLLGSAAALGWTAARAPEFTASQFRGRLNATDSELPKVAYGLRLGTYPVIVAPLVLTKKDAMKDALRILHSQMVIARSYMSRAEIINAHIFLCATSADPEASSRTAIDVVERDESVCRKMVWVPEPDRLDQSYEKFLARTFLASPWRNVAERHDASLDRMQGLAELLLVRAGLPESVARDWLLIAEDQESDIDSMVERLVLARGLPQ
jgi:hypothetical protein